MSQAAQSTNLTQSTNPYIAVIFEYTHIPQEVREPAQGHIGLHQISLTWRIVLINHSPVIRSGIRYTIVMISFCNMSKAASDENTMAAIFTRVNVIYQF